MTARQACEAALAAEEGDGPPSRAACFDSKMLGNQAEDFRNRVASALAPQARPNLDDLALSTLNADAAARTASDRPWGALARCDIARRLGNADLMEACLADLKRVAPSDPLTRRAMSYLGERTPVGIWMFRVLLSLGLFVTLAHALGRRRKRARPVVAAHPRVSGLAVGILFSVAASAGIARAQDKAGVEMTGIKINDADPLGSLPSVAELNKNPLKFGYVIQMLLDKAEKAGKKGDHLAEARYYFALTKIAPNEAYAPRKLCAAYEAAGDVSNAILACRTVVGRPGTNVNDMVHFVGLVIASKGPLPAAERQELDEVIDHLAKEKEGQLGPLPTTLRCEVALRFNDFEALKTCTKQLAALAPADPKTISLQWALALEKHNRSEALALIGRARDAGMGSEGIAKMERATRVMTLRRIGLLVVLTAVTMGALLMFVRFRRESARRRLAV